MSENKNKLPKNIKLNYKLKPGDDFYNYVCYHWTRDNPRPAAKARWSQFHQLAEKTYKRLKGILGDWQKATNLNEAHKRVVTYHQASLKRNQYSANSLQFLNQLATAIMEIEDTPEAKAQVLGYSSVWEIETFFALSIETDTKDNQRHCLFINPGSSPLPGRDYYLLKSAKMKQFRSAYLDFLGKHQKQMKAIGFVYKITPDQILEIETSLASFKWPLYKAQDIQKTHHPFTWEEFTDKFDFGWSSYCQFAEIEPVVSLIVRQPHHLTKTLNYLQEMNLQTLKQYCLYRLALRYCTLIDDKFTRNYFNFFGKTLAGTAKLEPFSKRVSLNTINTFCDTFGQAYVDKYFPDQYRQSAKNLALEVGQALGRRLANNHWMSETSRQYAQDKLDQIIINVGYSRFWANYSSYEIVADNPLANAIRIEQAERKRWWQRLYETPNRHAFGSLHENIQTINAWTNLHLLNTNYPAGFLQPPFYDHKVSFEYNLGALGSVIGHELTHNFDTSGAVIDKQGNLNPWLSKAEHKAFKKASAKLIKTANEHYVAPKVKMHGRQVIDEAIADLGGLEIVLDIVKAKYYKDKKRLKVALQTVFIAYAFTHAINQTQEARIMLAKSGVHPDAIFRVNGIVAHCDDFYTAFDVTPEDALYIKPSARALIW